MHVQLTFYNQQYNRTKTESVLFLFGFNKLTAYDPGVLRQKEFVGQIEFPRAHSSSSNRKNIHIN
jgi:hypothetical protein